MLFKTVARAALCTCPVVSTAASCLSLSVIIFYSERGLFLLIDLGKNPTVGCLNWCEVAYMLLCSKWQMGLQDELLSQMITLLVSNISLLIL